jgi:hypothetical protein
MTNRIRGGAALARTDADAPTPDEQHFGRERSTANPVRWRFYRGDKGLWHWQKISSGDALTTRSSSAFASFEACETDAVRAGYRPLAATTGLMPLSLVRPDDMQPALPESSAQEPGRTENRSPVLKKRVAHPAIERIFSRPRTTPATRRRTPGYASSGSTVPAKRNPAAAHGKSRLSRA